MASATSAAPASPFFSGDFAAMAAAQRTCVDTQEIISKSSLKIKFFPTTGKDLACDVSQVTARPVVPVSFRQQIFSSLHNIAYPSIRASKRLISARFVWKKMGSQIAGMCRDCQSCARSKTTSTAHSSVQPIEMPARRFSHVHIDLVGPLPASSSGHTHLFTAVDRSTRWPEAIPLAGTTTADCVEAFLSGWVSRFGVPAVVTSDRGVQFTSAVWSGLCQRLGINHKLTTAYHPQANGLVERFHRQLKEALRARLDTGDWYSQLLG